MPQVIHRVVPVPVNRVMALVIHRKLSLKKAQSPVDRWASVGVMAGSTAVVHERFLRDPREQYIKEIKAGVCLKSSGNAV